MNVLAVDTTMLFDTESSAWTPRLKSYEEPAASTEPFVAKAMLVPFTAVLSGSEIAGRTHEYVSESPFLRFEKNMQFHRLGWMFCGGSTTCELEYAIEKGVETTTSETFSHTVGSSRRIQGRVTARNLEERHGLQIGPRAAAAQRPTRHATIAWTIRGSAQASRWGLPTLLPRSLRALPPRFSVRLGFRPACRLLEMTTTRKDEA